MKNPIKFAKKKVVRAAKEVQHQTKKCVRRTRVSILKAQNRFMGDALDTMMKINQDLTVENADLRAKLKSST